MRLLLRGIEKTERLCLWGSVLAVLMIMIGLSTDTLARKMGFSIPALYELTQDYLLPSVVFLSISHVFSKGGHVRVTLFEPYIPGKLRLSTEILMNCLSLCFVALVAAVGLEASIEAWNLNELSSSVLAYPLAPAYLLIPIGCGLTGLRLILQILGYRSGEGSISKPTKADRQLDAHEMSRKEEISERRKGA